MIGKAWNETVAEEQSRRNHILLPKLVLNITAGEHVIFEEITQLFNLSKDTIPIGVQTDSLLTVASDLTRAAWLNVVVDNTTRGTPSFSSATVQAIPAELENGLPSMQANVVFQGSVTTWNGKSNGQSHVNNCREGYIECLKCTF